MVEVLRGVGLDRRIGEHFMRPGPGYGGSCFPKDTSAMLTIAQDAGYEFPILEAVIETDRMQRTRIADRIEAIFDGSLDGVVVGFWGAAFKAGTDDTRESPALVIARELESRGASIRMWDPEAETDEFAMATGPVEVVDDADLLVVATEWPEFLRVDLSEVAKAMRGDTVFDARNLLDPSVVRSAGLTYHCLGRPRV